MLNHGYFALQRANVLVFDECHHILSKRGGGGHAYEKIMDVYKNMPKSVCKRAART
jgi:ERCC4-related helicase